MTRPVVLLALGIAALALTACGGGNSEPVIVPESAAPIVSEGRLTQAVGIETLGGTFTPIILSGAQVPVSVTEVFSTAADRQAHIDVSLFRGTEAQTSLAHSLDRVRISGFNLARAGQPQIAVTFSVAQDGTISLSARGAGTTTLALQRL